MWAVVRSNKNWFLQTVGSDEYGGRNKVTQSKSGWSTSRKLSLAVLFMSIGLQGCGMSSMVSGFGSGMFGGDAAATDEVKDLSEETLLSAAKSDSGGSVGGMMVLDCIASGTIWVDMEATGVDVLISAPQKGWSGSPCCALVMMSEMAHQRIQDTASNSFACDLKKWLEIMEAYEGGAHAYHATMPTDALTSFRNVMNETAEYGFEKVRNEQQELGDKVRAMLESRGIVSVAAEGFKAPGVVVSYTTDSGMQNGSKFAAEGMQIAAGVPLQCDEPADYQTFRLGLFGLDKLHNVDRSVASLESALDKIM